MQLTKSTFGQYVHAFLRACWVHADSICTVQGCAMPRQSVGGMTSGLKCNRTEKQSTASVNYSSRFGKKLHI